MLTSFKSTIRACYVGYITQAIGINFIPLLYLYFSKGYGLSLGEIAIIPSMIFCVQILVDLVSAKLIDKVGYRAATVAAHLFAAVGIGGMGFLPELFADPYWGILASVLVFSTGCGLIEVVISPLVQACPTEEKSSSMGFLHSFYCWGQAGVVLITTLLFFVFGLQCWRYVAIGWAIIPAVNAYVFTKVPIRSLEEEGKGMPLSELFRLGSFWIFIILMVCAGASELAVAQWASAFAEAGLNVSKSIGDITGPCFFAVLMGISRIIYSKYAAGAFLKKYMLFSAILCVIGYLMVACQPNAVISLIGCGVCGFSVGVMWPGTYSVAAERCPRGGTEMFAYLALAGDLGCSAGVSLVGVMSDVFGGNLRSGILCAVVFPLVMIIIIGSMLVKDRNKMH